MVEYDQKFIKNYADSLYEQSKIIIPAHFFIGILIGLILFGAISLELVNDLDFLITAIGVMIGGVFGYGSGRNKSNELKLQAQLALLQVKIEENSRG